MSASERDKAELRDAAARSRLEYEDDKKARRARLKVAPVAKPEPDPFLYAGDIAEYVTVLEAFAADAEDTELSRAVDGLRSQVTRVGNLLARRRETYKENRRGGDSPPSAPAAADEGKDTK